MPFTYNKLWKLLIDTGMNKTQLREAIGIGTATLAKLSANEKVSLDVIEKLCKLFNCQPSDIFEYVPDETEHSESTHKIPKSITKSKKSIPVSSDDDEDEIPEPAYLDEEELDWDELMKEELPESVRITQEMLKGNSPLD